MFLAWSGFRKFAFLNSLGAISYVRLWLVEGIGVIHDVHNGGVHMRLTSFLKWDNFTPFLFVHFSVALHQNCALCSLKRASQGCTLCIGCTGRLCHSAGNHKISAVLRLFVSFSLHYSMLVMSQCYSQCQLPFLPLVGITYVLFARGPFMLYVGSLDLHLEHCQHCWDMTYHIFHGHVPLNVQWCVYVGMPGGDRTTIIFVYIRDTKKIKAGSNSPYPKTKGLTCHFWHITFIKFHFQHENLLQIQSRSLHMYFTRQTCPLSSYSSSLKM